ncbi:MAG: hypothetical protein AAGL49_02660 [Pseudomonadota bacterium]
MLQDLIARKIAHTLLHPVAQPFPKTPADYGVDYEDVSFPARDGVRLSGWLLNSKAAKVVVMTHFGYRANRFGYQPNRQGLLTKPYKHRIEFVNVAKRLVDADYAVLMYDLRNHGESAASRLGVGTGGPDERHDVLGAAHFLSGHAATRGKPIGLLSYCMGANATFFAFEEDAAFFQQAGVAALVAMQPLTNGAFLRAYGVKGALYNKSEAYFSQQAEVSLDPRILQAIGRTAVPTLLVQARKDPWTDLEFIQSAFDALPAEKELHWLDEPTHRFDGYNWFADHPEKMLEWFDARV